MAAKFTLADLTPAEGKELLAGLLARRKALDKAFKACAKEELQGAMDKVAEKVRAVVDVETKIKDAMSDAEV